jgi:hypothetical protein
MDSFRLLNVGGGRGGRRGREKKEPSRTVLWLSAPPNQATQAAVTESQSNIAGARERGRKGVENFGKKEKEKKEKGYCTANEPCTCAKR